ncbi:netrin receptor DCC-like [Clarias gariepinus]|uniref:uncharacterized protein LOC128508594 n=1 Tax=Clarias gariepinus TaxID=13013 RepID=UPI00234C75A3|nr:uncharacterized protein LOC128508594 [Clarias gariepinus]
MCVFGSLVRMQVCFLLLLIQLHATKGCTLEQSVETKSITAYTGDTVLLPCSCTDLTTPGTFTWEKYTNKWVKISPEQYKDRFQLVNDHSSGNLSLLISHLTVEDDGFYRCSVGGGEYRVFRLTVKGCTLERSRETKYITADTGDSVLLPCSCTDLHTTPGTFTWKKLINYWVDISPEQYKDRFQLVNDHSSGNLSLLISHLTVKDGGDYRCSVGGGENRDVILTVKVLVDVTPTKPTLVVKNKMNTHPETCGKESLPFVPFAVVTVIFLHIIVAVVYCSTIKKDSPYSPDRVHYSRADGDGKVNLQKRTSSAEETHV